VSNEINFIHRDVAQKDIELFGFEDDASSAVELEDSWMMAHVMHAAGIFPSVGQARKQGWDMSVPRGFWMKEIGKKKLRVCILNKIDE